MNVDVTSLMARHQDYKSTTAPKKRSTAHALVYWIAENTTSVVKESDILDSEKRTEGTETEVKWKSKSYLAKIVMISTDDTALKEAQHTLNSKLTSIDNSHTGTGDKSTNMASKSVTKAKLDARKKLCDNISKLKPIYPSKPRSGIMQKKRKPQATATNGTDKENVTSPGPTGKDETTTKAIAITSIIPKKRKQLDTFTTQPLTEKEGQNQSDQSPIEQLDTNTAQPLTEKEGQNQSPIEQLDTNTAQPTIGSSGPHAGTYEKQDSSGRGVSIAESSYGRQAYTDWPYNGHRREYQHTTNWENQEHLQPWHEYHHQPSAANWHRATSQPIYDIGGTVESSQPLSPSLQGQPQYLSLQSQPRSPSLQPDYEVKLSKYEEEIGALNKKISYLEAHRPTCNTCSILKNPSYETRQYLTNILNINVTSSSAASSEPSNPGSSAAVSNPRERSTNLVELIAGCGLYVTEDERYFIKHRARKCPQKAVANILLTCVGEEKMSKMCALGKSKSGNPAIPNDVYNGITAYIWKFCQKDMKPSQIHKLINRQCGVKRVKLNKETDLDDTLEENLNDDIDLGLNEPFDEYISD